MTAMLINWYGSQVNRHQIFIQNSIDFLSLTIQMLLIFGKGSNIDIELSFFFYVVLFNADRHLGSGRRFAPPLGPVPS